MVPSCQSTIGPDTLVMRHIDDIDLADEIFLIGSNPRNEAPVLTLEYGKHGLKERMCIC